MLRKLLRHKTASITGFGLLFTAAYLAAVVQAQGSDETPTSSVVKARITDVAWIAGEWAKEDDTNRLEESWSVPRGDSMIGMFRWIKDGKVWIYELLTIREERETLVLRFRHFGNDMSSWEPKNEPLTYRLASFSDNEVVFENPSSDSHRRYSFYRPDLNTLVVRVGAVREGKTSSSEFVYHRQGRLENRGCSRRITDLKRFGQAGY